jgi:hypothetical protein
MKHSLTFSLIAATVSALGISSAFADDPNLQNRLAIERAQDSSQALNSPSMAIYSTRNGVGARTPEARRPGFRFHLRSNPQGQFEGSYSYPSNR